MLKIEEDEHGHMYGTNWRGEKRCKILIRKLEADMQIDKHTLNRMKKFKWT
jgi:hypothetical protein